VKPSQYFRAAASLSSALDYKGLVYAPFAGVAVLEYWKPPLSRIVIPSLSVMVVICIAALFWYCTALWIDS